MLPTSSPDVLEAVRDAPAGKTTQSLERKGRSRAVATQTFASEVVARFDAYVSVKVEPIAFDHDGRLLGALLVVVLRILILLARQRGDAPASHGDGGARVDPRALSGVWRN
jgi:hypothetical protein